MRLAEKDDIWTRGGVPVEELPDPFGSGATLSNEPPGQERTRRRRWPFVLYTLAAIVAATLVWLVITAPLSRALEPLSDPALLLVSDDGHPIALRGAIKEAPVDVTKLNPLTPAAFVAIEDRRFYRHWGIDPRGMGRAFVADMRGGGVRQGGSTITQQL
ncbi:MAG TPA: transglycosylase domain-containing protein, partial [Sphingomicrobium sp.]|nr:transglycosylase domain-containing protein [Sphingomicrobium sp.]